MFQKWAMGPASHDPLVAEKFRCLATAIRFDFCLRACCLRELAWELTPLFALSLKKVLHRENFNPYPSCYFHR